MKFFVRNPNCHNNSNINAALVEKAKAEANDDDSCHRWALEEIKSSYVLKEIMGEGSFGTVRKVRSRRKNNNNNNNKGGFSSLLLKLKQTQSACYNNNNSNRNSNSNNNNNYYACKTIPRSKVDDINLLKEECANLEAVRGHPHLLEFVQVFEDSQDVHIITELLEGGELYETILELKKQNHKQQQQKTKSTTNTTNNYYFRDDDAAWMVRNILDGLSYCHDVAGIVHRDLKASNFMFKRKVNVLDSFNSNSNSNSRNNKNNSNSNNIRDIKIIDFGLTTKINPETGLVQGCLGTAYYVAPEVLKDDYYTSKCDVWSIGVIAYLILSNNLPFQGKDEQETVHMLQDLDAEHQILPTYEGDRWLVGVEPEAIDFCKSLLQVDPSKRPTAREAMSHPWIVKHCGNSPPSTTTTSTTTTTITTPQQQEQQHQHVADIANIGSGEVEEEEDAPPLMASLTSLCSSQSFDSAANRSDSDSDSDIHSQQQQQHSHSHSSSSLNKVIMESIPEIQKQQEKGDKKINILQRWFRTTKSNSKRTRQKTMTIWNLDEDDM